MKNCFQRKTCGPAFLCLILLWPAAAPAQRQDGWSLGIGTGRLVPLDPLASADGNPVRYMLDDGRATSVTLDRWFNSQLGVRASYQWMEPDMAEPDGPAYARIYSLHLGLLYAPVRITTSVRPFVIVGGGVRRYNVNAFVGSNDIIWDIADTQNRVAAYGGAGLMVRLFGLQIVPEAGLFRNSFKHQFPCQNCSGQQNDQLDLVLGVQVQFTSQR